MKYGKVEDHDPGMVFVNGLKKLDSGWPPEPRKPFLAKPCPYHKIS
jgi:hypothetical protein